MPRPTTKSDLLEAAELKYQKLRALIQSYDDPTITFGPPTLNRDIADVLCHLHEWHNVVLGWYNAGMRGGAPDISAKGYNWRQIPALNQIIWERFQYASLSEAMALLVQSHRKVIDLISRHDNAELFTRKRYKWCGNNAMGAYLVICTSSHYEWARKLIRKGIKASLTNCD